MHTHHRQVCCCMCSGISIISAKFSELEHLKVDDFSRKFRSLNLSELAPFKPQILPRKYSPISFILQILMKLEQLCILMYSDCLCVVWLSRNEAVIIDPWQEIMNGSGAGDRSMLSLSAAVGYLPVTHICMYFVRV